MLSSRRYRRRKRRQLKSGVCCVVGAGCTRLQQRRPLRLLRCLRWRSAVQQPGLVEQVTRGAAGRGVLRTGVVQQGTVVGPWPWEGAVPRQLAVGTCGLGRTPSRT